MAYAYEVFGPEVLANGALRYRILETEVQTGSEWEIPLAGLGKEFHLVRLQCDVLVADGVSTVQPQFGEREGWTSGGRGHIDQADTAAASVRIGEYKNFHIPEGSLFGRSTPDTNGGASTSIETFVTLQHGLAL